LNNDEESLFSTKYSSTRPDPQPGREVFNRIEGVLAEAEEGALEEEEHESIRKPPLSVDCIIIPQAGISSGRKNSEAHASYGAALALRAKSNADVIIRVIMNKIVNRIEALD
jgi:hypothetical protein